MLRLLLTLLTLSPLLSQNLQTFEGERPLGECRASDNSSLQQSSEHTYNGERSLIWKPSGKKSFFEYILPQGITPGKEVFSVQFFNKKPLTQSRLHIQFLSQDNKILGQINLNLNFRGWRSIQRHYHDDFPTHISEAICKLRFTLSGDKAPSILGFDDLNLQATYNPRHVHKEADSLDFEHIKSGNKYLLNLYRHEPDIPLKSPMKQELIDLALIRDRYPLKPSPDVNKLDSVRTFVHSLDIIRHNDGSIQRGKTSELPTSQDWMEWTRALEILAAASLTNNEDKRLFKDLLHFSLDKGMFYNMGGLAYSDYTAARTIPRQWMNILPACDNEEKEEVLKVARWISEYGRVYTPDYRLHTNADYIYNVLVQLIPLATHQTDDKKSIRELKAFSRYLSRCTEPTPGGVGFIKEDGTGFHHQAHYNGYMYAYNSFCGILYALKGTTFKIDQKGYERFCNAILTLYLMATSHSEGKNFTGNSLSGRHPLVGGTNIPFGKDGWNRLIEMLDDYKIPIEKSLFARSYPYFFPNDNKHHIPVYNRDGFYAFNYSPLGIYRYGSWIVVMRAPTTKFWGAEIYGRSNRFGRYQSHGTLEILYNNKSRSECGLPEIPGHWDWNMPPGSTTVHYDQWLDLMPNKNIHDRFDQYAMTTNFSGALSGGDYGIYATNFDQGDNWGGPRFQPTGLKFKKSYYAYKGMILCLGTDISTNPELPTHLFAATNLFQSIQSEANKNNPLILGGKTIHYGENITIPKNQEYTYILTPEHTGYIIFPNNESLYLTLDEQFTPMSDASDINNPGKSIAAKAYLKHQTKSTSSHYAFLVIPDTSEAYLKEIQQSLNTPKLSPFNIISANARHHIVSLEKEKILLYTLFEAQKELNTGVLLSTSSEMLLIEKKLPQGELEIIVNNPDLKPQNQEGGYWKSTPTQSTIVLKGKWKAHSLPKAAKLNYEGENTRLNILLKEGNPLSVKLTPYSVH